MSVFPAVQDYDVSIERTVETILQDATKYGPLITELNTKFPELGVFTWPEDAHIEPVPAEQDLNGDTKPRKYPAIRFNIESSQDFGGFNLGVARTLHQLSVRTFERVTAKRTTDSDRTVHPRLHQRSLAFHRAVTFLVTKHLIPDHPDDDLVYGIVPAQMGLQDRPIVGDVVVLRVSSILVVHQRTLYGFGQA